jgi:Fic/DOC family
MSAVQSFTVNSNIYTCLTAIGESLQRGVYEFSATTQQRTEQIINKCRDDLAKIQTEISQQKIKDQFVLREFKLLSLDLEHLESHVAFTYGRFMKGVVPPAPTSATLPCPPTAHVSVSQSIPQGVARKNGVESQEKVAISASNAGNVWLSEKIREYEKDGDIRGADCISFAAVNTICRNHRDWDLAKIFPTRTLTSAQVKTMSTDELLALKAEDFFAIIDLIDGEQGMKILESKANDYRKMGLYFFNTNLAATFARKHRELSDAPLDSATKSTADQALRKFKKYGPQEFGQLQQDSRFQALEQKRKNSSNTLRHNTMFDDIDRWDKVNMTFLANGLQLPVTEQMLSKWNTALRPGNRNVAPELRSPAQPSIGLRGPRNECSQPSKHEYYVPGHAVQSEMGLFLAWLNREIGACDQGTSNPIIIAALAYHKFVGIHPYMDGNGRTGRCLADAILRRYQLLPAVWEDPNVATFPVAVDGARVVGASNSVVMRLIQGLENSYKTI